MMRKVGTQVVKWTTEGAVKEDTRKSKTSSILRREGIRQLPGICWYPVRAQAIVKQGGTAGNVYDPVLDRSRFCHGRFFCNLFRAYGEIVSMSKRKPQRGDFTN